MIIPQTLKLETDTVILRPLQHEDISLFARITNEASLWRYFTFLLNNSSELQRWVETALKEREEGKRIPFTIIGKASGDVCGSTSLGSISYYDKRIEIGWSWLGKHYQGTGINFHAKFCMLSYAFDVMDWERVEIKTDNLNVERQTDRAIVKLNWKKLPDAIGYNIRFGTAKDKLYHTYQVLGAESISIHSLNAAHKYYFTIDAFNESGVTKGTKIIEVN